MPTPLSPLRPLRPFRSFFSSLALASIWGALHTASPAQTPPSPPPPHPLQKLFDANLIGLEATLQGEYLGSLNGTPIAAQVVARGDQHFHALLFEGGFPMDGWNGTPYAFWESDALHQGQATFRSPQAEGGLALLTADGFTLTRSGQTTVLKRVQRQSPTLGQEPPPGAVVLFDGLRGNTSLEAFQEDKTIEGATTPMLYEGSLLAGAVSKQHFGDFALHVEFFNDFEPDNIPWRRADSGVYLHARYEVAIGDSFGFDFDLAGTAGPTPPTFFSSRLKNAKFPVLSGARNPKTPVLCGSIFGYPSKVPNACLPPLTWQTYDIDFKAPRFDEAGTKTAEAIVSVRLNGHLVVDQQQVPRPTAHGAKGQGPTGPIWLEAFGRRVLYRNIWVLEPKL